MVSVVSLMFTTRQLMTFPVTAKAAGEYRTFVAAPPLYCLYQLISPVALTLGLSRADLSRQASVECASPAITSLRTAVIHEHRSRLERSEWRPRADRPANFDRLTTLAERVKTLSDKQDRLAGANPDRGLAAMNRAHSCADRNISGEDLWRTRLRQSHLPISSAKSEMLSRNWISWRPLRK